MARGRVLIVDDDESEAKIFRFYLEALPVEVKVAGGTAQATELLGSERFHAVLCDLVMDGGGGLDVLRFVQSQGLQIPVIIITGPLMYVLGGWTTATNWLLLKIILVCLVAIPIEIVDYHLSHFGGNKRRLREAGDMAGYERSIQQHWMFFLVTSPPIMVFAVLIVFLAITKPF